MLLISLHQQQLEEEQEDYFEEESLSMDRLTMEPDKMSDICGNVFCFA